jgi:uncharacterized protein
MPSCCVHKKSTASGGRSPGPLEPADLELSDILVEVVYALPQCAIVKSFRLSAPATVADALRRAAGDADFSGIDLAGAAVGVFGVPVRPDQPLTGGERIEIYRALAVDPKSARRARVEQARRSRSSRQ